MIHPVVKFLVITPDGDIGIHEDSLSTGMPKTSSVVTSTSSPSHVTWL